MGISAQIKNSQLIPLYQALLKQAESSILGKYFKPYDLLKHEVNAFGFYEPDFLITDEQAQQLDAAMSGQGMEGNAPVNISQGGPPMSEEDVMKQIEAYNANA